MARKKRYTLTLTAEKDFRQAKVWSLMRWGHKLTQQYFSDVHGAAQYIAEHHASLASGEELFKEAGFIDISH